MKQRVLILASHSTFRTAPRGIQANRFIKAMAQDYEVYLITSNDSTRNIDEPFEGFVKQCLSLEMPQSKWRRILRVVTPYFLQISPKWITEATSKGAELIEVNSIEIVISLSMTLSNAEVGYQLKKMLPHIKWLSFFSDPISISPYFARNSFDRWLFGRLEHRYFSGSSGVVSPSMLMTKAYSSKYAGLGTNKFVTIPHNHPSKPDQIEGQVKTKNDGCRTIRYIGGMNTIRSPLPLIHYIESEAEWFVERGFRFEFYGGLSRELKRRVSNASFDKRLVEFCGKVPYSEVPQLMTSSAALLAIDADFDSDLSFGNSKIYEMLPYGVPIIALTPNGSETARVLTEIGYLSFAHSELSKIKNILEQLEEMHPDSSKIELFSVQSVVRSWRALITDVNNTIE